MKSRIYEDKNGTLEYVYMKDKYKKTILIIPPIGTNPDYVSKMINFFKIKRYNVISFYFPFHGLRSKLNDFSKIPDLIFDFTKRFKPDYVVTVCGSSSLVLQLSDRYKFKRVAIIQPFFLSFISYYARFMLKFGVLLTKIRFLFPKVKKSKVS
ncbi:hypothetical protein H6503_03755 [Candidatus Woesearchaeota archaeon]|nr:hypothetical protein [Candidatus Woesearchaeota archaeon]